MKQFANLLQQMILELVLLPFNLCVLILAILDAEEIEAKDHRKNIGEVMVYINVITPFLAMVLMAVKFLAIGYEFYKDWKAQKNNTVKPKKKIEDNWNHNVSSKEVSFPKTIYSRKPLNNQLSNDGTGTLDISQSFEIPIIQDNSFVMRPRNDSTMMPIHPSNQTIATTNNLSFISPELSKEDGHGENQSSFVIEENMLSPQKMGRRTTQNGENVPEIFLNSLQRRNKSFSISRRIKILGPIKMGN